MEHLPDRDPPPFHAGYRGHQGRTRGAGRWYQRNLVFPGIPPTFLHVSKCLLCLQVIMIECADLKNVINYQEVEALKHTIKVLVGDCGEARGRRHLMTKPSLQRFCPSSNGGVPRATSCRPSFGSRSSMRCLQNGGRLCPDARYDYSSRPSRNAWTHGAFFQVFFSITAGVVWGQSCLPCLVQTKPQLALIQTF